MKSRRGMENPRGPGPGASPPVVTIDVAHPPLSSSDAERALDEALRAASLSGRTRVIRVIHGYGSGGKGGTLKTAVRNWAFRRRAAFDAVIPGEEYSPLLGEVQEFLKKEGEVGTADLADANEGMTLLLLK